MIQHQPAGFQPRASDSRVSLVTIQAGKIASRCASAENIARQSNEAACPHRSPHFLAAVAPIADISQKSKSP
jgi:hypothetical protein